MPAPKHKLEHWWLCKYLSDSSACFLITCFIGLNARITKTFNNSIYWYINVVLKLTLSGCRGLVKELNGWKEWGEKSNREWCASGPAVRSSWWDAICDCVYLNRPILIMTERASSHLSLCLAKCASTVWVSPPAAGGSSVEWRATASPLSPLRFICLLRLSDGWRPPSDPLSFSLTSTSTQRSEPDTAVTVSIQSGDLTVGNFSR